MNRKLFTISGHFVKLSRSSLLRSQSQSTKNFYFYDHNSSFQLYSALSTLLLYAETIKISCVGESRHWKVGLRIVERVGAENCAKHMCREFLVDFRFFIADRNSRICEFPTFPCCSDILDQCLLNRSDFVFLTIWSILMSHGIWQNFWLVVRHFLKADKFREILSSISYGNNFEILNIIFRPLLNKKYNFQQKRCLSWKFLFFLNSAGAPTIFHLHFLPLSNFDVVALLVVSCKSFPKDDNVKKTRSKGAPKH